MPTDPLPPGLPDAPAGADDGAVARPTPARADQRRNDDRILRAASRLLAEDPGATIQAIADAAGVTRLTVYRRFPNRQAMEVGLRAIAAADARAALDDVEKHGDAEVLAHLVPALLRMVRRHPLMLRRHRVRPGEQANPVDLRIAAVLARAQAAGVLRPDVSPDLANAMVFAVLTAVQDSSPGLDDAAAERWALTLLLDGLGPAGG